MVEVRPATIDDAAYIGKHMRQADRREVLASHNINPFTCALSCLSFEPMAGGLDGVPFVLFGCVDGGEKGYPWLLGTDDIERIKIKFVRQSRVISDEWKARYPLLENYVHAENTVSIEWLKWLGFELKEHIEIHGEDFIRFEWRRENV